MKKVYTPEIKKFILGHYRGTSSKELANMINKKFGLELTTYAVKSYLVKNKLKTEYRCCPKYTAEIIEYIINNYQDKSNKRLSEEINKKFNTTFNGDSIGNFKSRMLKTGINLRNGINDTRFNKGHVSANKGKKWDDYMSKENQMKSSKTTFKKGNIPQQYRPVGSERITKDGYIEVKVADPNKWRLKHRIVWEAANGLLPRRQKIVFLDGNGQNVSIDNLILVSDAEMLIINRNNLINEDPDLTRTGTLIAKVIDKTNKRKKRG